MSMPSAIFLAIGGTILYAAGLVIVLLFGLVGRKPQYALLGIAMFGVGLCGSTQGLNHIDTYYSLYHGDINSLTIQYKSISVDTTKYFAIGKDGTVYGITKEQWAALQVPVIAETK
jgi:hypothetical protein